MKMMYTVHAVNPPALYGPDYFPRQFRYKKDAVNCAKWVVSHGATSASVTTPNSPAIMFPSVKSSS